MSRSSFGQPPQPMVGMQNPKMGMPGPASSPKAAPMGGPSPMAPPPPQAPQRPMGGMQPPSMFRRPRY